MQRKEEKFDPKQLIVTWNELPEDVVILILTWLSIKDLLAMSLVSKQANILSSKNLLWKQFVPEHFVTNHLDHSIIYKNEIKKRTLERKTLLEEIKQLDSSFANMLSNKLRHVPNSSDIPDDSEFACSLDVFRSFTLSGMIYKSVNSFLTFFHSAEKKDYTNKEIVHSSTVVFFQYEFLKITKDIYAELKKHPRVHINFPSNSPTTSSMEYTLCSVFNNLIYANTSKIEMLTPYLSLLCAYIKNNEVANIQKIFEYMNEPVDVKNHVVLDQLSLSIDYAIEKICKEENNQVLQKKLEKTRQQISEYGNKKERISTLTRS